MNLQPPLSSTDNPKPSTRPIGPLTFRRGRLALDSFGPTIPKTQVRFPIDDQVRLWKQPNTNRESPKPRLG